MPKAPSRYDPKKRGDYLQTPHGKLRRLLQIARHRAKQEGMEFSVKFKDLSIPTTCPALDIPIYWHTDSKLDNRPSLDRVDNSRGYTKENTRIISWRANVLKRDATLSEIAGLLKYMADNL
jgi:hypothetical protein